MKKSLIIISSCLIVLAIGWVFKLWTPSHEKQHSALPPHSFYSFALTRSDARIPCLQGKIEGISFLAKLDMGYDGVLSLPKHLLEQLKNKSDDGTALFAGIKGRKYETPAFIIPKLNIEDLTLVNFPAEESSFEFERDTNLGSKTNLEPSNMIARIGWRAFLGTVILLDVHNSKFICCDSIETLKEKGYPLEQFVSINLLSRKQSVEFEAIIGSQIVKCLLDTGCTINLIHNTSNTSASVEQGSEFGGVNLTTPLPSTPFFVNESQLGSYIFYETQLPFETEAILGVDFLETQIICIDFINHKLYLSPIPVHDSLNSDLR